MGKIYLIFGIFCLFYCYYEGRTEIRYASGFYYAARVFFASNGVIRVEEAMSLLLPDTMVFDRLMELPAELKIPIIKKLTGSSYARLRRSCRFMDEFCGHHRRELGISAYYSSVQFGWENSTGTIKYCFRIQANLVDYYFERRINPELSVKEGTVSHDWQLIPVILNFIVKCQRRALAWKDIIGRYLLDAKDHEELILRAAQALVYEIKEKKTKEGGSRFKRVRLPNFPYL